MTSLSSYVLVASNVLRPIDDDAETIDGSIVQGLPAVGGGGRSLQCAKVMRSVESVRLSDL